ncbi:prepilin peptidase [Virgibacillus soli]|uniref:prepilin peptidase n=2 Tax=Paracerasibacillus soli TaxID=480284 RepID=UPI0035EF4A0F
MEVWLGIYFTMIGLCFGSFFHVVGLRMPKYEKYGISRSRCPACRIQLRWTELIPVLSFILQKGNCKNCHHPIPISYPFIELLTGTLFLMSYIKIGLHVELVTALLLISMLIIVFVSDITYMIIPNRLLLFFLPLLIGVRIIQPLHPWWSSIIGSLLGFGTLYIIILVSRGGMGAGDMKLFGVLGIVLGVQKVLLAFFLACFLGALFGGLLIISKNKSRKHVIPFGPFIVFASIISYFYGQNIVDWYVGLLY